MCVILFHLLHFEGKKKRAKQMTEKKKKRLSRGFAGRKKFLNALFKKKSRSFLMNCCLLLTVSVLELWKIKEPFKRKHTIT